ncbi:DUF3800 domain-containing protein [Blastococcus sp. TF02A-35]|nr:DUF3800 domain-containing protein [Blastococcus sp. TF02A_35]
MFYVDDSGVENTGWATFSWIQTTPNGWRAMLRRWLDLRKELYEQFRIPPSVEIHATKFLGSRGRPSTDPAFNHRKQRIQAAELMLSTIAGMPGVGIGTAYRHTTARGSRYAEEKADLYLSLTQHLDQQLADAGNLGLIFMDGTGTDPTYRRAHRALKLATRSIVEDPIFQGSHLSQPVQAADLIAWTTYQHLLRHPGKKQFWTWYQDYLQPLDVNGGPIQL